VGGSAHAQQQQQQQQRRPGSRRHAQHGREKGTASLQLSAACNVCRPSHKQTVVFCGGGCLALRRWAPSWVTRGSFPRE
jgi:ribosomal protein L44E